MSDERTYSTREVAQMWNVSESTVKRWADTAGLDCYRTPGGHRKFRLEDLCSFQAQRAFEATGLLTTEEWEDPNLEVWLNTRNYAKVRDLLLYLGSQNQRGKVTGLLERLYLRGMRLEEIYDQVLVPLQKSVSRDISRGQALVLNNNLEEAIAHLSPKVIKRRKNGKTALCASPTRDGRMGVFVLSVLLEVEGWDSMSLGENVSFDIMSEMVETEPINLVCLFLSKKKMMKGDCNTLNQITGAYRIPVVLVSTTSESPDCNDLVYEEKFTDLTSFRRHLARLTG
jgi:excisionase family DNA binding protein